MLNKIQIIGNLGKEPEIKHLPNGTAIANFSVATSESWNDKNGDKQTSTEWHNCSFFGKLAEVCGEYLKKGSQVYVEGSIKTRKWQDKEGNDRYTTSIVGRDLRMLGSKPCQSQTEPKAQSQEFSPNNFNDDIPF